jgi:hypothetical protein
LAELTVDKPTLIENVTLAMPYIARKIRVPAGGESARDDGGLKPTRDLLRVLQVWITLRGVRTQPRWPGKRRKRLVFSASNVASTLSEFGQVDVRRSLADLPP